MEKQVKGYYKLMFINPSVLSGMAAKIAYPQNNNYHCSYYGFSKYWCVKLN